jgi:hypothetical protein
MKLSDEKARRLTALVWRERARRWLPIIAVTVGIFAVVSFFLARQIERADRTVDVKNHEGTVIAVKRGGARGAAVVRVHLDDGRDVDAFSALRLVPLTGTHVVIGEARHASGRLTYDVVRFGE